MKVDATLTARDWAALPDEARRLEAAGCGGAQPSVVNTEPPATPE
jgi:hypothetical protein